MEITFYVYGKAVPLQARCGPEGSRRFRAGVHAPTKSVSVPGVDIVVATSTTQVSCTHIPTKSLSAPAAISVVLIFHVIFMAR
jgi:hypothetical protein